MFTLSGSCFQFQFIAFIYNVYMCISNEHQFTKYIYMLSILSLILILMKFHYSNGQIFMLKRK